MASFREGQLDIIMGAGSSTSSSTTVIKGKTDDAVVPGAPTVAHEQVAPLPLPNSLAATQPNAMATNTLAPSTQFEAVKREYIHGRLSGISNKELFNRLSIRRADTQKSVVEDDDDEENARPGRCSTDASMLNSHQSAASSLRPIGSLRSPGSPTSRRVSTGTMDGPGGAKRVRRAQIFQGGVDFGAEAQRLRRERGSMDRTKEIFEAENSNLIRAALSNIFFSDLALSGDVLNRMLDSFEKINTEAGEFLMKEGGDGDAMYVVKSGELDVFIKGEKVRSIGAGDAVGELALLFSAPRSATVKATSNCVLWALHRDRFREVQAVACTENLVTRFNRLSALESMVSIDRYSLSRLAGIMSTEVLQAGSTFILQGDPTDRCFLVEGGKVDISATRSTGAGEIEKLCGIPHNRECATASANGESLILSPGAFIGMPVLLCAGGGRRGAWTRAPAGTDVPPDPEGGEPFFPGAISMVTVTALENSKVAYFTVEQFSAAVGPIREIFSQQICGRASVARIQHVEATNRPAAAEDRFEISDFEQTLFLGTGSFGRVTMVKFKDQAKQEASSCRGYKCFAMKALSKQAVIDRGQLSHVQDERKMLLSINHPFILKLLTTFQDLNSIYFLTEAVMAGEMWSVVYEGVTGYGEGKLPIESCCFYASCVLEALGHMHGKGIAYRDLKPENIMMDAQGYLRVIDLGFAKQIPFFVDVDGVQEVHPKSFTMCGTPEYLAPEFIFNSGHDRSVDYWAFGVLCFELTAGYTPFQHPNDPSDMTALFTRIACSKRDKVRFPRDFDAKAKGTHARDLVVHLLASDPSQRLGNLAAGVDGIRRHPYFAKIDWVKLVKKELPVPWKPPSEIGKHSEDEGEHKKVAPYKGKQEVFADF